MDEKYDWEEMWVYAREALNNQMIDYLRAVDLQGEKDWLKEQELEVVSNYDEEFLRSVGVKP